MGAINALADLVRPPDENSDSDSDNDIVSMVVTNQYSIFFM